eukprot:3814834-Karenia_brevis.AAC.1
MAVRGVVERAPGHRHANGSQQLFYKMAAPSPRHTCILGGSVCACFRMPVAGVSTFSILEHISPCLLYTSDAADDM